MLKHTLPPDDLFPRKAARSQAVAIETPGQMRVPLRRSSLGSSSLPRSFRVSCSSRTRELAHVTGSPFQSHQWGCRVQTSRLPMSCTCNCTASAQFQAPAGMPYAGQVPPACSLSKLWQLFAFLLISQMTGSTWQVSKYYQDPVGKFPVRSSCWMFLS